MSRKTDLNLSLGVDISAFEKGLADALKISTSEGKKLEKQAQMQAEAIQQQMAKIGDAKNLGQVNAEMNTLVEMMVAFGLQGTKAFQEIITQAGELKKKQEDIKNLINANMATPYKAMGTAVQGVAQAFSVVQSGMAIFGDQSEDTQKTLLKVQSAMGFAVGVTGLLKLKKEFKELGALINTHPIFFAAAAIALIATAAYKLSESLDANAQAQQRLNEINQQAIDKIQNEVVEMNNLVKIAKNEKVSRDIRQKAIDKLQKTYPNYLSNINLENIGSKNTAIAIRAVTSALLNKAKAQIVQEELVKSMKDERDLQKEISNGKSFSGFINYLGRGFTQAEDAIVAARINTAKLTNELANLTVGGKIDFESTDPAKEGKKPSAAKKEKKSNSQAILKQALKDKRKAEDEAYLLSIKDENTRAIERLKIKQREQDEEVQLKIDGFAKIKKLTIEDKKAISALKNLKSAQDITQEKELDALIAEQKDKSLKDKIAREKKYAADIKKITEDEYNNTLKSTDLYYKELDTKLIKSGLSNEKLKDEQLKLDIQRLEQQKLNAEDYGKSIIEIDNEIAKLRNGIAEKSLNAMAKINEDYNKIVQDSLISFTSSISETIGEALITGEDVDFGAAIISALGDFMKQVGKMMIVVGIAKMKFDTALSGFGSGGLAIVAGAALVAAGSAMNAVVQKGMNPTALAEGGVLRGTTFGMLAEYPTANNDPEVAIRSSYLRNMIGDAVGGGGGNMVASLKVSGRDLYMLIERGKKDFQRG